MAKYYKVNKMGKKDLGTRLRKYCGKVNVKLGDDTFELASMKIEDVGKILYSMKDVDQSKLKDMDMDDPETVNIAEMQPVIQAITEIIYDCCQRSFGEVLDEGELDSFVVANMNVLSKAIMEQMNSLSTSKDTAKQRLIKKAIKKPK